MEPRRGAGFVEALVGLLLTAGLLIGMAGILVHQQRLVRALGIRIETVEAARMTRDLVSLAVAADPEAEVGPGGLAVRNFVGLGQGCGNGGWVYRGRRLPDPARDSLWLVSEAGRIRLARLVSVGEGQCASAVEARVLDLEADPPLTADVGLFRVFESGRYRLDDAFRYGRRGSGAQPLTAPVLDPARSGISTRGSELDVQLQPGVAGSQPFVGTWTR